MSYQVCETRLKRARFAFGGENDCSKGALPDL